MSICAGLLACLAGVTYGTGYIITDFGDSNGLAIHTTAINASGDIAGYTVVPAIIYNSVIYKPEMYHPFVYSHGVFRQPRSEQSGWPGE